MEVTSANFDQEYPTVQKAIEAASFIAIDCEFSGLHTTRTVSFFDTPREYYGKLHKTALGFQVLQVGICTFEYNRESQTYSSHTFRFYVRPWLAVRGLPDRVFHCQASTMEFLGKYSFDFNKALIHGISYLRPGDAERLLDDLNQRHAAELKELHKTPQNGPAPSVPDEHKDFIVEVLKQVSDYLEKGQNTDEVLHLPDCDAYQRKLIYQTLASKYAGVLHLETQVTQGSEARHVVARRFSLDGRERELKERHKASVELLEAARGFTRVLDMISRSRKLVVGHNMLLDLMHLLHQFVDDLPSDLEEFKAVTKAYFPAVLDTKLLASVPAVASTLRSTTLSLLLAQLKEKSGCIPDIRHEKGYGFDGDSLNFHDAGADAFATGSCLLGLVKCLYPDKIAENPELDAGSTILQSHLNKVYFSSDDVHRINLDGVDVVPNRVGLFHVTFPMEWRMTDLRDLFSPYGDISVSWISDTEAAVKVRDPSRARAVMSELASLRKDGSIPLYRVQTYNRYMEVSNLRQSSDSLTKGEVSPEPAAKRLRSDNGSASSGSSVCSSTSASSRSNVPASLSAPELGKHGQTPVSKTEVPCDAIFEENDDWV